MAYAASGDGRILQGKANVGALSDDAQARTRLAHGK